MKILSLFDGMSCGMIAMLNAGQEIERYVAFEIDNYAKQVSLHNFPKIEQRGDVFDADFVEFEGFDFLMGGSPCTFWSCAQHPDKRETTSSGIGWELFSQYTRALNEAKPKYFIYENNKSMSKDIRRAIDEAFGFEAVLINSALVSAQNRNRLYWVGKRNAQGGYDKVEIEQPADRGILLKDILDGAQGICTQGEKSQTLKAQYAKNSAQNGIEGGRTHGATMVATPICVNAQSGDRYNKRPQPSVHDRIYDMNGKNPAIHTAHQPSIAEPIQTDETGKSRPLQASYGKCAASDSFKHTNPRSGVAEPLRVGDIPNSEGRISGSQANRVYSEDAKSVNLVANGGGGKATKSTININLCGRGMNGEVITTERKSRCVTTNKGEGAKILTPIYVTSVFHMPHGFNAGGVREQNKANTLTTSDYQNNHKVVEPYPWATPEAEAKREVRSIKGAYEVKNGQITIEIKGEPRTYPIKLADGFYIIRKLTVAECARLQTVPDWYDFSAISNTQAYKCLGNGWTCDVITHLINACLYNGIEIKQQKLF